MEEGQKSDEVDLGIVGIEGKMSPGIIIEPGIWHLIMKYSFFFFCFWRVYIFKGKKI